jgi:hypothetical protein
MSAPNTAIAWQRRLLPVMASMLVLTAIFFAWESVVEYSDFKQRVVPLTSDLAPIFDQFEKQHGSIDALGRIDYLQWKSLIFLEQEALKNRYAQGHAAISAESLCPMSRRHLSARLDTADGLYDRNDACNCGCGIHPW